MKGIARFAARVSIPPMKEPRQSSQTYGTDGRGEEYADEEGERAEQNCWISVTR